MECNDYPQKNPNLYIELTSVAGDAYLLREEGGLILRENGEFLYRSSIVLPSIWASTTLPWQEALPWQLA